MMITVSLYVKIHDTGTI